MNCVNTPHSTCSSICQTAHKSPLLFFTSSRFACSPSHEVPSTTSLSCSPPSLHKQADAPFFSCWRHAFPKLLCTSHAVPFSASSFPELWTRFSLRAPLAAGACQIIVVLLKIFTVITHKYGSNHPRGWMLSTSKLGAKKKKKKGLHPHALPFTCLPLNGEQFPSRWQAIKGFTLLHLVKMLNKEVPFPPCSEREQAVLVLPREQISPWHDLPPASRSRAETATALLLHCTSPQRQSLLVSDVTIPSSPSRVCSTRWCSWKWAGSVCWEAWYFWSRRLRTACFWLCELQQPGSVAAIASDCKRLTWKRMGGCDLGLRQNWFCLTVEGSYPGTERWWDSSSFPTVVKPSYCQQK